MLGAHSPRQATGTVPTTGDGIVLALIASASDTGPSFGRSGLQTAYGPDSLAEGTH